MHHTTTTVTTTTHHLVTSHHVLVESEEGREEVRWHHGSGARPSDGLGEGGDPYDVSDAEGGSSHHPSTYHDEDYPRASPPQSPFEDEGFMDMHEVVNEVSRPVTAASSRKGLGLTRMHSDKGRDLVDAFAGAVLDDLQHTDGRERLRRRSVDYAGEGAAHMGYSGYPSDSERDYRAASSRASHVSWATGGRHDDHSSEEEEDEDGEGGEEEGGSRYLGDDATEGSGPEGRSTSRHTGHDDSGFDPDDHF